MKSIKDINGITNGFTDKKGIEYFIYDLYENKYSKGLNDFWLCNMPEGTYKKVKEYEALDLTLKYLYPLLRDGKLKVKIRKYIHTKEEVNRELQKTKDKKIKNWYQNELKNWDDNIEYNIVVTEKEYKREEAKKAIKDIRKRWLSFNKIEDRNDFEMFGVAFTLPENEWDY